MQHSVKSEFISVSLWSSNKYYLHIEVWELQSSPEAAVKHTTVTLHGFVLGKLL